MVMPAELAEIVAGQGEWEGRAWFPPGPALGVCLAGGRERLGDLSDAELLEVAAAAHRQAAWAQSRELAAIAELSRRRARADQDGEGDPRVLTARESVTEEVASTLTVTGNAAATLVHLAERLAVDLPGTREALEAGRIDMPKARVICDLSEGLPEEVTRHVEDAVIGGAAGQTTGQLRRRIRRIVQRLAPEAIERRRSEAVARRRLEVWDTASGTADLALLDLAPEEAHGIYNKITAVAAGLKSDGDVRPLNLIRADLAKTLLHGAELPEAVRALLTSAHGLSDQDEQPPPPARPSVDEQSALPGHAHTVEKPAPVGASRVDVSELLAPMAPMSAGERPAPVSQMSGNGRSPTTCEADSARRVPAARQDDRPALVARGSGDGHSSTARVGVSDLLPPVVPMNAGERPSPAAQVIGDDRSPAIRAADSELLALDARLHGWAEPLSKGNRDGHSPPGRLDDRSGSVAQVDGDGRSPTARPGEEGVPAPAAPKPPSVGGPPPRLRTDVDERPTSVTQMSRDGRSPIARTGEGGELAPAVRSDGRPAPVSQGIGDGRTPTARVEAPATVARLDVGERLVSGAQASWDGCSPTARMGGDSELPVSVARLDVGERLVSGAQASWDGCSPTAPMGGDSELPAPVTRLAGRPGLAACVDVDEWGTAAIPAGGAFIPAGMTGPGDDLAEVRALAGMIDRRLTGVLNRARALGRLEELPEMIGRAVGDIHDRLATAREAHCQGEAERHGHPGHRPPAAMRREVEERHATCVFPTCNIRSSRCDLDHTTPWSPGVTCACNLAPLCRRHHRTKQTRGWQLTQIWPGLLVWVTPSGAWHITLPNRA
ncbi:DUF222 domain-containing protein [Actinomadura viridis]|uniref:HNH endonuclease signature motif containing protein n=1 Tax=Actinomadura viridis TaxID=58110 RepID=UPI003694F537